MKKELILGLVVLLVLFAGCAPAQPPEEVEAPDVTPEQFASELREIQGSLEEMSEAFPAES